MRINFWLQQYRKLWLVVLDSLLVSLAFFLSFVILFNWPFPPSEAIFYRNLWPVMLLMRLTLFYLFDLYKWSFRYASIHEFLSITKAVGLGSIVLVGISLSKGFGFSRSVILIDFLLNMFFITGLRFSYRIITPFRWERLDNPKRVIIVGAGAVGAMVARELWRNLKSGYEPVGFIDDDPRKKGVRFQNLVVLGTRRDLPKIVREKKVDEIIIAFPSTTGKEVRDIISHCERLKVKFKIVPGINQIVTGRISIKQVRDVRPEDLLGREMVNIDPKDIAPYLEDKVVLVTGAAGSIGSELCRQVAKYNVRELILYDFNENDLYFFEIELRAQKFNFPITCIIGDIRDENRIRFLMESYHPHVVFHAAAHKHVPMMELNPEEAVKNNILGTLNLVNASHQYDVERFILISTDKAVNPTSVMGVTKRIAELLVQEISLHSKTKFVCVRFGNVLGSEGSVVPLFKRQIVSGGPVTVTHKEARRYFMTVSEAVQLILQAGALGEGGEVFILNMGEQVKIVDLARELITLSGLTLGKDIDIEFIGLRPGEKLQEELLTAEEGIKVTQHRQIFIAKPDVIDSVKLHDDLNELKTLAEKTAREEIIHKLKEIVPNYNISSLEAVVHDISQKVKSLR